MRRDGEMEGWREGGFPLRSIPEYSRLMSEAEKGGEVEGIAEANMCSFMCVR